MPRAASVPSATAAQRRQGVKRQLDELEHDGALTLDERLRIEAAARAAGTKISSPAGRRRRPGS